MIRIGLPAPLYLKIRLRAELAANRYARRAERYRTIIHHAIFTPSIFNNLCSRYTLRKKVQADMTVFEEKYQNLVDLLCGAARTGVREQDHVQYSELRNWFQNEYTSCYQPILKKYINEQNASTTADSGDPFESLYQHPNIEGAMYSTEMLHTIAQSRDILQRAIENK
jgi:hypothetical protein